MLFFSFLTWSPCFSFCTASRPKCEGSEQSNAYGEALSILDGLDREFADNGNAIQINIIRQDDLKTGQNPSNWQEDIKTGQKPSEAVTIQELQDYNDENELDVPITACGRPDPRYW